MAICEKKLIEDLLNNYLVKNDGTWNDAMDRAVELTKTAPKVGEWVSVDERLPNKDGYFLITTSDNEIDIREYLYSKGWGWDGFERVIAWQPLPEPYRKDVE